MPITGIAGAGGVARPFGGEPPKRLAVEVSSANPSRQDVARSLFQQFGFTEKDADYLARNFNGRDPVAAFADSLEIDPRSIASADGKTRVTVELSARDFATLQKLAARRPSATRERTASGDSSDAAQARRGYDHGANLRERLNRQMDAAAPKPKPPETPAPSQEGVGSFLEGAVAGDFSENDSWSAVAGQTAVGFIPIVGQIADARDIAAAANAVYNDEDGSWARLGIAAIAIVPGLDFLKAGSRVGRKALKEVAEEGLTQVSQQSVKGLAQVMSKEGVERISKEAVTLNVGRAEMIGRLDNLLASPNIAESTKNAVRSARNALQDHLTQDDLLGALRDKHGIPVLKPDGTTYDHLGEVNDALKSLEGGKRNLLNELRKVSPGTEEYRRLSSEIEAISEMSVRIEKFLEVK
jgi:hypothetical protein